MTTSPDPRPTPTYQSDNGPPRLQARWFHAADSPIRDTTPTVSTATNDDKEKKEVRKPSVNWVPFSLRDSMALERVHQNPTLPNLVPVNEDSLFDVDVVKRTISPVFWSGFVYEVRRATWFIQQSDASSGEKGKGWLPCEENLAEQIEIGYAKFRPWEDLDVTTPADPKATPQAIEEKNLEKTLEKQPEKHWNLLGKQLGQYVVYTGPDTAWLLSDNLSGKITKTIFTTFTKSNLGGVRLLRSFQALEKISSPPSKKESDNKKDKSGILGTLEKEKENATIEGKSSKEVADELEEERMVKDYENEDSQGERTVDNLVLVIHGIGQKLTERMSWGNFIHDINVLRHTLKTFSAQMGPNGIPTLLNASTTSSSSPQTPCHGVQVLPIQWRKEITFGMAAEDEKIEHDIGLPGNEDGQTTLDEITLEGVPSIRMLVSDVVMDILLYMTPKYREQMLVSVTRECNRVYDIFLQRNPDFVKRNGKVHIYGHSLGSVLAFELLTVQPAPKEGRLAALANRPIPMPLLSHPSQHKIPPLNFNVDNFFALGSPIGLFLLLKGCKIAARSSLLPNTVSSPSDADDTTDSSIPLCYPSCHNLYNIFHKADPVAYRLEPLISRHYSVSLKPEPVPYSKGGLKGVLDSVGSDIALKAGAMYESLKTGFTASLFVRGLKSNPLNWAEEAKSTSVSRSNSAPSSSSDTSGSSSHDVSNIFPSATKPLLAPTLRAIGARKLRDLNVNGRVDFCIQEGILENAYVSALSVHMNYWSDQDVAAFIIRECYRSD